MKVNIDGNLAREGIAALERKNEELVQRIEELERRNKELEQRNEELEELVKALREKNEQKDALMIQFVGQQEAEKNSHGVLSLEAQGWVDLEPISLQNEGGSRHKLIELGLTEEQLAKIKQGLLEKLDDQENLIGTPIDELMMSLEGKKEQESAELGLTEDQLEQTKQRVSKKKEIFMASMAAPAGEFKMSEELVKKLTEEKLIGIQQQKLGTFIEQIASMAASADELTMPEEGNGKEEESVERGSPSNSRFSLFGEVSASNELSDKPGKSVLYKH